MSQSTKLSQHTAILLERARRFGVTEETLLQVIASGDVSPLKVAEAEWYEYNDFLTYAEEHGEQLEQAVRDGYQMTFNTNNGLKVWLQARFNVELDRDYTASEGRILDLKLDTVDVNELQQKLAYNWVVKELDCWNGKHRIAIIIRGLE